MLKINIVAVGDIKEKYLREAIGEYVKRLSRFCAFFVIEIKENVPASTSEKDIALALKKDAVEIKKHLAGYVVVLDILGKQLSSTELAEKIQNLTLNNSTISFVIGASNGLDNDIKNLADFNLSISPMTFPHQLMRVILLEQVYRAFTILRNIPYHK